MKAFFFLRCVGFWARAEWQSFWRITRIAVQFGREGRALQLGKMSVEDVQRPENNA